MWQSLKTIVEDESVESAVDGFGGDFARFDEAWDALKWLLSRKAADMGMFQTVSDTMYQLYVQASDALADTPEIWVVFSCTDNEVVIHAVNAKEPEAENNAI